MIITIEEKISRTITNLETVIEQNIEVLSDLSFKTKKTGMTPKISDQDRSKLYKLELFRALY